MNIFKLKNRNALLTIIDKAFFSHTFTEVFIEGKSGYSDLLTKKVHKTVPKMRKSPYLSTIVTKIVWLTECHPLRKQN